VWKKLRPGREWLGGGVRGLVGDFSPASRFRMLKRVNSIFWHDAKPMVFITLTYPPDCFPRDKDVMNIQRARFWRYFEEYVGRHVSCLWRIEWEPRWLEWEIFVWYPHVHILAFGVRFVHFTLVNTWWKSCLFWENYCRTEIKRVKTEAKAGFYVAKYIGKCHHSLVVSAYHNAPLPGRKWGNLRPERLPVYPKTQWVLKDEPFVRELHLRLGSRIIRGRQYHNDSFTLLGMAAKEAEFLINENCVDSGFIVG
jgi:hypothetical protein